MYIMLSLMHGRDLMCGSHHPPCPRISSPLAPRSPPPACAVNAALAINPAVHPDELACRSGQLLHQSNNCSIAIGLGRCASKPASFARRTSCGRPKPVNAIAASRALATCARHAARASADSRPCPASRCRTATDRTAARARRQCLHAVGHGSHAGALELQQHRERFPRVARVVHHQHAQPAQDARRRRQLRRRFARRARARQPDAEAEP